MRKVVGAGALLVAFALVVFIVSVTATSLFRSDQGGTGADNSAAPNNAFAKWLSGTPATLTNSACTESGGVISGCTAPATAATAGFPSSHGVSTLGTVGLGSTVFISDATVDPLESNAQQFVNSARTVGGFGCVNPAAQGTGANHDIVVTLDTSACVSGASLLTGTSRTCTLTGAASGPQTCMSINGSVSITAGQCWAFKVVTQSALSNPALVNCTYDFTG